MKINIPDMSVLCRDNMLLNSNFASGIINQKGQITYSTNGIYTIDMWRLVGSGTFGGKVTVNASDILLENTQSTAVYFVNKTDLSFIDAGTYTLYVSVKELTGEANIYCDSDSGKVVNKKLIKGDNIITFDGLPKNVGFEVMNGCAMKLSAVKLEKGSNFTGMPPYNYGQQMYLCRRKFRTMVGRVYRYAQKADKFNGVQFPLVNEYEMDGTPTVTIEDIYKANCTIVKEKQFGYLYAQITPTTAGNYEAQFKVTINTYEN